MKFIITTLILVAYGLFSTANAGGYIGLEYAMVSSDITDHTGYNLKAGYKVNDFVKFEGKSLISSGTDTWSDVEIDIDSLYSVSLIFTLPVTNSLNAHVGFGHSRAEVTASYMGYSDSASDSSSSLEFGVSYDILEAYSITASYSKPLDDIEMIGVGLNLNF